MKEIANVLIFSGVLLLVGPFFGLTLRGAEDATYIEGLPVGIILLILGIVLTKILGTVAKNKER